MNENRSSTRHKTFFRGRIYFDNRRTSIDCLIRDMSHDGARLELPTDAAVPDVIELFMPHKNETKRSRVQWRVGREIGVSFALEASKPAKPASAPAADLVERVQRLEQELAALHQMFDEFRRASKTDEEADAGAAA
jgi:hypothetical protein